MKSPEQSMGEAQILNQLNMLREMSKTAPGDFESKVEDIRQKTKTDVLLMFKSAHTLIHETFANGRIDLLKSEDLHTEVDKLSMDLIGVKSRFVPEYYFEIQDVMDDNKRLNDWLYDGRGLNIFKKLENDGQPIFPSRETKETLESLGYTEMVISNNIVGRESFLSHLSASFHDEFGHEPFAFTTNASYTDLLQAQGQEPGPRTFRLTMIKPCVDITDDEDFEGTVGLADFDIESWEKEQAEKSHPVLRGVSKSSFNLEEYLFWQMHHYFKYCKGTDQPMPDSDNISIVLTKEKTGRGGCLSIKWDAGIRGFLIGRIQSYYSNLGTRMYYKIEP